MKTVCVTGAEGFIGSHLTRFLKEHGISVVSCSRRNGHDITRPDFFHDLPVVDTVIHLAATTYVPSGFSDPLPMYHTNILGTLNSLEYCRQKKIARFIYISSYVYGQPKYLPIDEAHPVSTLTPYNRSKYVGEILCRGYHDDYGISIGIVRPFNIYGTGQDVRFIIPTLIRQYLAPSDTIQVQSLKPRRDYLFVRDFIELLWRICQSPWNGFNVWNAGSGKSHAVFEVLESLFKAGGSKKRIISLQQEREREIMDTVADIGLAKKKFGWDPLVDLENGLREILQSYKCDPR